MNLPFDVDPRSWIFGIPFALACLSFYRLPMEHKVKAKLRRLFELEAEVLSNAFSLRFDDCDRRVDRQTQAVVLTAAIVISLFSLVSFLAFVGVLARG